MTADTQSWWHDRRMLQRYVGDLVWGELARLRPGRAPAPLPWPSHVRFDDLGIDSLERLQLATALAEAIHLHRSGIDDTLLVASTLGEWIEIAAGALDGFSAELTFQTSGSTGRPKWCVHDLADLETETALLAQIFAGTRRVISAVPSHHIYGFLFTILLPARLATPTLDVRAHAPSWLAGELQAGDLIIGHPDFWRAFARSVPHVEPGVTGATSTAPCPADVACAVRANGLARFVEVYGSSETAGIGWRDDPQAAYELFGFWRRGADDAELVRSRASGEPRLTVPPDRLIWDDERHVRPAGRSEGAVQVGGHNVFPDLIGARLCTHPDVAAAAVRLMRPDEGERLKAFIVPRDAQADLQTLRGDLWTWIDAHFAPAERPKSIVFGPALPATALGKPSDWPIADGAPDLDAGEPRDGAAFGRN